MKKQTMSFAVKLALVPAVSFILMIITVGIMGSFLDYAWFKTNMPNGLPVLLFWLISLYGLLFVRWVMKKQ